MKLFINTCICGSGTKGVQLFETRDYNFNVTKESAWILQCPACGSMFPAVFPSSETLGEAYSSYYTAPKKRHGLRKTLRTLIDATRAEHIVRNTPKSAQTVLDYGCGSGEYLNLLASRGYKAQLFGTDITRHQGDGPVVFRWLLLDDFDSNAQQYDWITLSHVIEHLPAAAQTIHLLRGCCSPKGGLWLSTPNANSVLISTFGGHARDVDFPRHRQIYSQTMLIQLLSSAGFDATFLPSPRIDTLMNLVSCVKNLARDQSVPITRKISITLASLLRVANHLRKPAALRAADSPETVVVGRPSKRGSSC